MPSVLNLELGGQHAHINHGTVEDLVFRCEQEFENRTVPLTGLPHLGYGSYQLKHAHALGRILALGCPDPPPRAPPL